MGFIELVWNVIWDAKIEIVNASRYTLPVWSIPRGLSKGSSDFELQNLRCYTAFHLRPSLPWNPPTGERLCARSGLTTLITDFIPPKRSQKFFKAMLANEVV
jgi:hypothetical protein